MAEEKPVEPEKKEYRLYRGETKKLKDLKEFPVVVQRPSPTGPLPRLMVIKSAVATWNRAMKGVTFWGGNEDTYLDLDANTEVRVLSGTRAKTFTEEYNAWKLKNLHRAILRYEKQIGADPEIFAVDENGAVVPSWKFLPAKTAGLPIPPYKSSHAYWDGFQAEFTTRPHNCMAYFGDDIAYGIKTILEALKAYNPKARLSIASVLPVPRETLENAEPQHVEFGCMPSKNVYGLKGNTIPGREVPLRFAGGHIHLGVRRGLDLEAGVRGLDLVLGVPSVSLFGAFDVPARREYYGQAGEYRTPPHGVEYRTLSNAWLMHPFIMHLVFELARVGFDYGLSGIDGFDSSQEEARDIIMETDPEKARAFMTKHRNSYLSLFKRVAPWSTVPENAYAVWFNGAESVIKDPEDFEKNWGTDGSWIGHSELPHATWAKAGALVASGVKL